MQNGVLGAESAAVAFTSSPNGPFNHRQAIMEPKGNLPGIMFAKRFNMFSTTNEQATSGDPCILPNTIESRNHPCDEVERGDGLLRSSPAG
jgi:hypothetical protein